MIENNSGTIRSVAWSELFPWLSIGRAFRLAISARALVFGAVGILLTVTGWAAIGTVFGTDSETTRWLQPFTACPWTALTKDQIVPDKPRLPAAVNQVVFDFDLLDLSKHSTTYQAYNPATDVSFSDLAKPVVGDWRPTDPMSGPWTLLTSPASEGLKETGFSRHALVCLILCGLWGTAVWAFFGAAICRTAAVRLAADEQIGFGAAVRFAGRKWVSYFFAPLMPIAGAALAAIPVIVLGWIIRADTGLLLGGVLWPLVLVAGFVMTVLLVGVLFGWPLMWSAISAEGTDAFDALSRSYAYVFQRPLRYLFYIVVAGVLGWLGWVLVQYFAAAVIWLGYWAAGWGCGSGRIGDVLAPGEGLNDAGRIGAGMIRFWTGCVKVLAVGYLFSYFWTASTAIYFLLRRDVDATELDEVFLDADATEQAADVPAANGEADAMTAS